MRRISRVKRPHRIREAFSQDFLRGHFLPSKCDSRPRNAVFVTRQYVPKNSASRAHRAHERRPGEIVGGCLISGRVLSFLTLPLSPSPRPAPSPSPPPVRGVCRPRASLPCLPSRILSPSVPLLSRDSTQAPSLPPVPVHPGNGCFIRRRSLPQRHAAHPTSRPDRGEFSGKVRQNEH